MKCLLCNKGQANETQYGITYCNDCLERHRRARTPLKQGIEFVPDKVKEDRKEHFKSILQPRREGYLSKEYIEAHGTKGIKATSKEIRKAKNLWSDLPGWRHRDRAR